MSRSTWAANDYWTNTSGGNWQTPGNWSLTAVPTEPSGEAYFSTGSATAYTVTFPGQETANDVYVQGDTVTFDTTNNSNQSLALQGGMYVTAAAGQTTSLTLQGNGGYGMECDYSNGGYGFNVGGAGTQYFIDNGVQLTAVHGSFNFAAGSIVTITNATIMGDLSNLIIRGTANLSQSVQGNVIVGGPGPVGAVLNGAASSQYDSTFIGDGGVATINGGAGAASGYLYVGYNSPGTLNDTSSATGEVIDVGTMGVAGVLNVSSGAVVDDYQTLNVGANGTLRTNGGNIVCGNYVQFSGGILELTLVPGTSATQSELYAYGSATLAGTVDVTASTGSTFTAGESFQILSFASETGTFSTIDLPTLSGGFSWNLQNLYTTGTISVVPEPMGLGALAAGAMVLVSRRRQRR